MRNGKCLTELAFSYRLFAHFIEDCVCVVVKSLDVGTHQYQSRIARTSNVELRRTTVIKSVKITHRHCRRGAFAVVDNGLRAEKYVRNPIRGDSIFGVVRYRLVGRQSLVCDATESFITSLNP